MKFIPSTVLGFFDSSQKSYEIPVYQRAYSWELPHWKTFLQDLLEQTEGDNNYFLGTILLEVVEKNRKYDIIDGQQRLTTLVIFISALLSVMRRRSEQGIAEFDVAQKSSIFLRNSGVIKLQPVAYDRTYFNEVIVDGFHPGYVAATPSQNRMGDAKSYFTGELSAMDTGAIIRMIEKLENTELTIIELAEKKDAALIFELQNNRGKDLTEMERLKSWLMYQMYVYSPADQTAANIEILSDIFKMIYLMINDIKNLQEDSILIYHNNAYIKGYAYRSLEDVKDVFRKSDDKVAWIIAYARELHTTFSSMKIFERSELAFAIALRELGIPAFVYPFVIKGYKYLSHDPAALNVLFSLLEILAFRTKLINSRANIQERLHAILLVFCGDTVDLANKIRTKLNETWYWGDSNTSNYLKGSLYGNGVLSYLLWRYENTLQNKGYGVGFMSIDDEQIEHISPQNPTNGEPLETGYEVDENNHYTEDFVANYLNNVGNLVLISGSHNASIGNSPFSEKLASYIKNPLLNQQSEISLFARHENGNPVWKRESIADRQQKIVAFAQANWSFDRKVVM